ncbi:MAG: endo-1,4-beta-xylanase [Phycisphaeraceae bacterium]
MLGFALAGNATPALADEPDAATEGRAFGIAFGADTSGDTANLFPMLEEAGINYVRMFPEWNSVQPAEGQWNWERADEIVANANRHGIEISGMFQYFASFASSHDPSDAGDHGARTRTFPIRDIQRWRDYVQGVVERYGDDIRYWEVWNEPNSGVFARNMSHADYAQLVREAHITAKAIDERINIGITCANYDLAFLSRVIEAGAADHFDFVAVHPYENVGSMLEGGERAFLELGENLRQMLASLNQPADLPLWITEIGLTSTNDPAQERRAADALVKTYVLAFAAGFKRVAWFEAMGPDYGHGDHGIIRMDGNYTKRPAYHALQTMTALLGPGPDYRGWLNLEEGSYGFVFDGSAGPVLALWSVSPQGIDVHFPQTVQVTEVEGKSRTLDAGDALTLEREAVFVTDLPAELIEQATANRDQSFPWGDDYSTTDRVSVRLGAQNVDAGLVQTKMQTSEPGIVDLDAARRTKVGEGGEGQYMYFRADPTFVGFGDEKLKITVVARRVDNDQRAGLTLDYESLDGYRNTGNWRSIPAGDTWQELTWEVEDANFVGGWGWHFRTSAAGSPGEFWVKEVRVEKIP